MSSKPNPTNKDIFQRVKRFNTDRPLQELVELKYHKMAETPFAFLRGSCHLFYEDWSLDYLLEKVPLAWICGDLHLENFGSYQGDNRLTYFDVNDFDESILAPCIFDITRLLTSIYIAFSELNKDFDSQSLARSVESRYKTSY